MSSTIVTDPPTVRLLFQELQAHQQSVTEARKGLLADIRCFFFFLKK